MNLIIGNTLPRTWKRFGVQHVAAAGAIALGLSLATAAAFTLTGDSTSKPTGPVTTGVSVSAPVAANGVTTYYVVGSQAEATRIEEGMAIAALEAGTGGYESVSPERVVPVIIETPEQETQFQAMLMALQQAEYESGVRVVDLRR
jgi:hypothetical protein